MCVDVRKNCEGQREEKSELPGSEHTLHARKSGQAGVQCARGQCRKRGHTLGVLGWAMGTGWGC